MRPAPASPAPTRQHSRRAFPAHRGRSSAASQGLRRHRTRPSAYRAGPLGSPQRPLRPVRTLRPRRPAPLRCTSSPSPPPFSVSLRSCESRTRERRPDTRHAETRTAPPPWPVHPLWPAHPLAAHPPCSAGPLGDGRRRHRRLLCPVGLLRAEPGAPRRPRRPARFGHRHALGRQRLSAGRRFPDAGRRPARRPLRAAPDADPRAVALRCHLRAVRAGTVAAVAGGGAGGAGRRRRADHAVRAGPADQHLSAGACAPGDGPCAGAGRTGHRLRAVPRRRARPVGVLAGRLLADGAARPGRRAVRPPGGGVPRSGCRTFPRRRRRGHRHGRVGLPGPLAGRHRGLGLGGRRGAARRAVRTGRAALPRPAGGPRAVP